MTGPGTGEGPAEVPEPAGTLAGPTGRDRNCEESDRPAGSPVYANGVSLSNCHFLTRSWYRDTWRIAEQQNTASMREPLKILARPALHNLCGPWRIECGSPALVLSPSNRQIAKIIRADRVLIQQQLDRAFRPAQVARLYYKLRVANVLLELFERMAIMNGLDEPQ
jgi:hypothetical protein